MRTPVFCMRKPVFCMYEYKGADQLRGNRAADQHGCFHNMDGAADQRLCLRNIDSTS